MWQTRKPAGLPCNPNIIGPSEAEMFEIFCLFSRRRNELKLDKPYQRVTMGEYFLVELASLWILLMGKYRPTHFFSWERTSYDQKQNKKQASDWEQTPSLALGLSRGVAVYMHEQGKIASIMENLLITAVGSSFSLSRWRTELWQFIIFSEESSLRLLQAQLSVYLLPLTKLFNNKKFL